MASLHHPFVYTLVALFCREGSPFSGDDQEIHRARIAAEMESGQWVMLTDEADQLLGWMAWYRVDDEAFDTLQEQVLEDWIREDRMTRIDHGPNLVIADAVVAPWAPKWTYKSLYNLVRSKNTDAVRVGARLVNRRGVSRFHERRMDSELRR